LAALFGGHGTVDRAAISTQKRTGRSKGYGFVEMPADQLDHAIENLNGFVFGGRPLQVRPAR
jgi:RNA recognition motif-containing protein